jgi:hypothetical protein
VPQVPLLQVGADAVQSAALVHVAGRALQVPVLPTTKFGVEGPEGLPQAVTGKKQPSSAPQGSLAEHDPPVVLPPEPVVPVLVLDPQAKRSRDEKQTPSQGTINLCMASLYQAGRRRTTLAEGLEGRRRPNPSRRQCRRTRAWC